MAATFGNSDTTNAYNLSTFNNNIEVNANSGDMTAPEDGQITSIFAYMRCLGTGRTSVATVYEYDGSSDYDLKGNSDATAWDPDPYDWIEFPFSSPVSITKDKVYGLGVEGGSGTGSAYVNCSATSGYANGMYYHGDLNSNPLSGGTWYSYRITIYAEYTPTPTPTAGGTAGGLALNLGMGTGVYTETNGGRTPICDKGPHPRHKTR